MSSVVSRELIFGRRLLFPDPVSSSKKRNVNFYRRFTHVLLKISNRKFTLCVLIKDLLYRS